MITLKQIQSVKFAPSCYEDREEIGKASLANTWWLCKQIQSVKLAPSRNEDREEIGKASLANTWSLSEQIQSVKKASSRNEEWEGDMFGLPAEPPWHFEIFYWLIWHPETCTRSIYPNMSALQCNFCSGSVIVTKLSTIWGIGNPTDFQVSWGTWLPSATLSSLPSSSLTLSWQPAW